MLCAARVLSVLALRCSPHASASHAAHDNAAASATRSFGGKSNAVLLPRSVTARRFAAAVAPSLTAMEVHVAGPAPRGPPPSPAVHTLSAAPARSVQSKAAKSSGSSAAAESLVSFGRAFGRPSGPNPPPSYARISATHTSRTSAASAGVGPSSEPTSFGARNARLNRSHGHGGS